MKEKSGAKIVNSPMTYDISTCKFIYTLINVDIKLGVDKIELNKFKIK